MGLAARESMHFIGPSLVGTVGLFDLRLLGLGQRIRIAAMHRLIPWGLAGFGSNAVSGIAFLLAEPDQYVYNPSFHVKVLFIAAAGMNALTFHMTTYVTANGAPVGAPPSARIVSRMTMPTVRPADAGRAQQLKMCFGRGLILTPTDRSSCERPCESDSIRYSRNHSA